MNIYAFDTYKVLLKTVAEEKKERFGSAFTMQNMAKAAGVQKTYLSKVFADPKTHLSEDQLYKAGKFLSFSDKEMRFLELLYRKEKTQIPEKAVALQKEILRYQQKEQSSESSLSDRIQSGDQESKLFLDPYLQLVTVFLTLEPYRERPEKIQKALQISKERLQEILHELQTLGIIAFDKAHIRVLKRSFHLPAKSPLQSAYRTALRLASLQRLQAQKGDYSFSVIFSANPETRAKIQSKFLEFLKEAEKLSQKLDKHKGRVYQMNFDLLHWSE